MSKQIRMACALMDLLRTEPVVTARMAIERIEYDDGSIRQALKVLAEHRFAEHIGTESDGRTKRYRMGPKLRRPA